MDKTTLGFAFGTAALFIAACSAPEPQPTTSKGGATPAPSGSRGGESKNGSSASSDDDTGSEPAGTACVTKADKGNALGVGAYCDKETRCKTGQFCTADFGAPEGAHFCTVICGADADCGSGAICFEETRGKGCVPNACVGK